MDNNYSFIKKENKDNCVKRFKSNNNNDYIG